jgi:hypothetical protein
MTRRQESMKAIRVVSPAPRALWSSVFASDPSNDGDIVAADGPDSKYQAGSGTTG